MLSRGEPIQRIRHTQRCHVQFLDGIAQVQANRRQHLIIPRAAQVNAPTRRADPVREPLFEGGLTVLVYQLDPPLAAGVLLADRSESGADCGQVGIRQKLLSVEHLSVRNRTAHVITDQTLIECVILPSRVLKYSVIEGSTLVPETTHVSRWAQRSAARRG